MIKERYRPKVLDMAQDDMNVHQAIRYVFWTWNTLLPPMGNGRVHPKKLLQYYDGVSKDYHALIKRFPYLSQEIDFMDGVTDLFNEADKMQKIVEAL